MLKEKVKGWMQSAQKEVRSNLAVYLLLAVIVLIAFYVRVYRADQILAFYFDQGRDALVIWKLLHEGKPFLIGPVTGLAGIFLGPFYYYLIAPFYFLGGGNPIYPAAFLAFVATSAVFVVYYLGWKMYSRTAGLLAAAICSFSYYLVLAGRWLANPTPILLTSILLFGVMYKLLKTRNQKLWILIAFLVGISLHFEAASAIFYLPMIFVFFLFLRMISWGGKESPPQGWAKDRWRVVVLSIGVFLLTLLPQILFNLKHENILFTNFQKVLVEEKSFRDPLSMENLVTKKNFFWDVFKSKVFPGDTKPAQIFYFASLAGLLSLVRKKSKELGLFAIFLGIPMVGYVFFQGNYGNIYDYYLTGYYLPMVLLFSIGLAALWKNIIGKMIIVSFLITFLSMNGILVRNKIRAGVDGSTNITLGNQMQAVNWVFENLPAGRQAQKEFNIDVYVPPVIPHAYDYLLLWQANKRCGGNLCGMTKDRQVSLLYTLFEEDPPHPERLEAWMKRQEGIGEVEEEVKFGGITVQRRKRI